MELMGWQSHPHAGRVLSPQVKPEALTWHQLVLENQRIGIKHTGYLICSCYLMKKDHLSYST